MPEPMVQPEQTIPASLTLIRPDGSEGDTFNLQDGENILGRNQGELFSGDGYLSPEHARITVNGAVIEVADASSLNGVFVKMTAEEEIGPGQIFRIGQELLRYDSITTPQPLPDGTEIMGSPNPGYWGRLTVLIGKDIDGASFPLLSEQVSLGRERGDINFSDDGYVSGLHAQVARRDSKVYLSDLGSSNGTFIRIDSPRKLGAGSFVLLGQQLFRINVPG